MEIYTVNYIYNDTILYCGTYTCLQLARDRINSLIGKKYHYYMMDKEHFVIFTSLLDEPILLETYEKITPIPFDDF